jgi:hypothetical protein
MDSEDVAFENSTENVKHRNFLSIMWHEYGLAMVPAVLLLLTLTGGLSVAFYKYLFRAPETDAYAATGATGVVPAAVGFARTVRTGVTNLVANGVAPDALLFNSPDSFATRLTATDQQLRAVFHPDGGNVEYKYPDLGTGGQRWHFNAELRIQNLTAATDTDANDIIAFLPGVRPEACAGINDFLGLQGVPQVSYLPAVYNIDMNERYRLPAAQGPAITGMLDGIDSACFYDTPTAQHVFYALIYAR